jgi:hypothetical protein
MFHPSARPLARNALTALLACAAATLLADAASAATKVSGTHSFGQVAAACGAAGGSFNVHTSGGYSCTMSDLTQVTCNAKGQCTSTCGTKTCAASRGLKGVLRPPASAGTASAARGASANNNPPAHSINHPVVVQRSGGSKH